MPTEHQQTSVLVVAAEPGSVDVKTLRPLSGPAGWTLDKALDAIEWSRKRVATTNVVLCQPGGRGGLRGYEDRLKRKNKDRVKRGEDPILLPTEACKPRLLRDLERYDHVIPLGSIAFHAVVPWAREGILNSRGFAIEVPVGHQVYPAGKLVFPTVQPGYVNRSPRWFEVFAGDLLRAIRWFQGKWETPKYERIYRPDPAQLEDLLGRFWRWRGANAHYMDLETQIGRTTQVQIRTVQFGGPEWAVVVPMLGIDGHTTFYPPDELHWIRERLKRWATDPNVVKVGQNIGSFDHLVLRSQWGVQMAPYFDGILAHRSAYPDYPHNLGFIVSTHLLAPNWKGAKTATEARTDADLWAYGAEDIIYGSRVVEPTYAKAEARQQVGVMALDHTMQRAARGAHLNGMWIDQAARGELEASIRSEIDKWRTRMHRVIEGVGLDVADIIKRSKREDERNRQLRARALEQYEASGRADEDVFALVPNNDLSSGEQQEGWILPELHEIGLDTLAFNPNSHPQLRAVLFEQWDLPIPTDLSPKDLYTKSGQVSTGDAVLRRLVTDPAISREQRLFLHCVRMFRKNAKLYGTYIRPFRPLTGDPAADKGCRLYEDGRIRPSWLVHTTPTGRWSSVGPNGQNLPFLAKTMVQCDGDLERAEGFERVLVATDFSQVEFRIAASLYQIEMLLEAFAKGLDAYQMIMLAVFGEEIHNYDGAPHEFGYKTYGKNSRYEQTRKLAKALILALQYGAEIPTATKMIRSSEDPDNPGLLPFAYIQEKDVYRMRRDLFRRMPEYERGWARMRELAHVQGYLEEPVTGRRRDFPKGSKPTEIYNTVVQSSAAGLMNTALAQVLPEIPHEFGGPKTGLINQCHDEITFECYAAHAHKVADIVMEAMNLTHRAFPNVTFTAEADISRAWAGPTKEEKERWKR